MKWIAFWVAVLAGQWGLASDAQDVLGEVVDFLREPPEEMIRADVTAGADVS